jgi:hypothetical protein
VAVPRDVILADVRQQVAAGALHITFGDPDFLNGPTHAMRLVRELHAEFPQITFDFTAKIAHLLRHRAHLPELRAQGCLFIVSAAESLSDEVLGHLDKGHTRADVLEVLRATRAAGISLKLTWVPFTPWTTLSDYRELLEFHEDQDLIDDVDAVQFTLRLLVPPGSLLLDSPAMHPHLGGLEPATLSHRWTHPDPRMDRLQERAAGMLAEFAPRGEAAAVTFDRIRRLADEATGFPARSAAAQTRSDRPRSPRITEPWFC